MPDPGSGLGQRQRLIAEVISQVDRPEPLIRIRPQARHQVRERLAAAEHPDRNDHRPVPPAGDGRTPRGHQDRSRRTARPQPVQVGRIPQVIEDDHPPPASLGEPAHHPARRRLTVTGDRDPDRGCRLAIPGQHRSTVRRRHPDQHVNSTRLPHRLRRPHRQLRPATRRIPRPRRRQHHQRPGPQSRRQARNRLRPIGEAVRERGHRPAPDRRTRQLPRSGLNAVARHRSAVCLAGAIHPTAHPIPERPLLIVTFPVIRRRPERTSGRPKACQRRALKSVPVPGDSATIATRACEREVT
jgi:hypothetical protein